MKINEPMNEKGEVGLDITPGSVGARVIGIIQAARVSSAGKYRPHA